jgi:hypothetical protein
MATFTFKATTEGTRTLTEINADIEVYPARLLAHSLVAIVSNAADLIAHETDLERTDVLNHIITALTDNEEN